MAVARAIIPRSLTENARMQSLCRGRGRSKIMVVLETEWWSLLLPPEWIAEEDEDEDGGVVIGDSDGVGCIEFSELRHPQGIFTEQDTRAFAEEQGSEPAWQTCSLGQLRGVSRSLVEDGV